MKPNHVPAFDILVIGETFVEMRCRGDIAVADRYQKDIGGADMIVAVASARLGSSVSLVSAVGRDPFHNFIREELLKQGVNIDHMITAQGYNGFYIASERHVQDREYLFHRPGSAAQHISPNLIYDDLIDNTKIVYASSELQSVSKMARHSIFKAFHYAHSNDIMVAYDPNLRLQRWGLDDAKESLWSVLPLLDVILPSAPEETKALFGYERPVDVIGFLWDRGVSIVVVKHGSEGCWIGYDGRIEEYKPETATQRPTNCTLIGSVFNGAFLHCIGRGQDPFTAAEFAVNATAHRVQSGGGIEALPSASDIANQ